MQQEAAPFLATTVTLSELAAPLPHPVMASPKPIAALPKYVMATAALPGSEAPTRQQVENCNREKKKKKIRYISDTAGRRIRHLGPFNSAQNEQSPFNSAQLHR